MRKVIIILFSSVITVFCAEGQTEEISRLREVYHQTTDKNAQLNAYYDLAYAVLQNNPEKGITYSDTLEQLAKKARDLRGLSRAEYLKGYALEELGKFDDALPHHKKEVALALQTNDLELHGKAFNSLGNCFQNLARYDSAIVYLIRSAEIKEKVGNQKDLASAYANIGNVYSDQNVPEKAVEWLEKALAIRLSIPEGEKSAIFTYNNISVAYNGTGNYDKAIEYAQKGYELADKSGNNFLAGVLSGTLAHLWMQKSDYDKAIEMAENSIRILREANRESNLVFPYATLSEVLWRKGNYAKSLQANQEGFQIMEQLKLVEPLEEYYKNFANAYESLGNPGESIFWLKKYMNYKDSLYTKENVAAIAEVETKYETQKKEAQLIKQDLELERQFHQKKNILLGAIAVLLGFVFIFQYLRFKQKTKQKETELFAQLRLAETEKLKELDTIKSNFFANISHEFRTPLTLILSPVEQMINGSFEGDPQKYYRIIHQNGKRLLNLINQLLDLSKLESGKLKLQVSEGDMGKFINAVAGSFQSLAVRKEIDYQVEKPEQATNCFFDKDKVEKILVNLISNAFKFTGEGGKIAVGATFTEGYIRMTVSDTGIGIPASQIPHIFERFTQSQPSEVQAGSGIGLALTKELTELHGGEITVESEEGKGTSFSVMLPVEKSFFTPGQIVEAAQVAILADEHQMDLTKGTQINEEANPSMNEIFSPEDKPLLLLVEDNNDLRAYIAEIMSHDFKIIEAENGKQAIEKAIETTPDMVITDVMMPEMDGIEFCRLIKTNEKTSHVPVIMLTARAEQSDKFEGLETGADDYILKPFDARELKVRAANLVSQREQLQKYYRRVLNTFSPAEVKVKSMDAAFMQKIKEVIEARLDDEQFNVVDLGQQIGMSRSQLHRKLSALTGFSPNEVIRNMRLERAKQLIEQKAGTVSEVAYLCGFSSPTYFIKCFREYFGSTPGQIS